MQARKPAEEQIEVRALRKRIRGEKLDAEEQRALERVERPVPAGSIPHSTVLAELAERERRGA
jgi:hypothetical protein